jgi:hypothetical protein
MSAAAPRVYVYRKSGRAVWDVEIWLPNGTRKTWRSGLADREVALRAGFERAQALIAPPDAGASDSATVATEVPTAAVQGDQEHEIPETSAEVPPRGLTSALPSSFKTLLDRFDRWFWGQLGVG